MKNIYKSKYKYKYLIALMVLILISALSGGVSYTIFSNGIVKDNSTGLYWTRCTLYDKLSETASDCTYHEYYTWNYAIERCENLVLGGREDWRLPNIKELQSIVVYYSYENPKINEEAFPGTINSHYWSSTTHINSDNIAWTIDFQYGNVTFQEKFAKGIYTKNLVRCVSGPD